MKFRAIIVGNPGERGEQSYCAGVDIDLGAYPAFLGSALGGAWREDEVKVLRRPSVQEVRTAIAELKRADYSLAVFCGHGHVDARSGSTILTLKRDHEVDSNELRVGAPKHTLILDCCRVVAPRIALDEAMRKAMVAKVALDPDTCRTYYEAALRECADGLIVLFACAESETANDDATLGGIYSSSLISSAQQWSNSRGFQTATHAYPFTVVRAHADAAARVDVLSGGRQHPNIQKPRSAPYFPFGIVA